jgi:hypothetical protein
MKWAFGIVLVVVAGAVAAFAIYTWARNDSVDKSRVEAYANVVAATCDPTPCEVTALSHVSGDAWKAVYHNPNSGAVTCLLVQANHFAARNGGSFAGVTRMTCPEQRGATTVSKPAKPPPPPIGPKWWLVDEATENVGHSKWASDNGLAEAIFDCIGQGRSRNEGGLYRRFACTYSYGGPNYDKNGRIEIVTTGRDSFRVLSN